jgi:hypothetical protein
MLFILSIAIKQISPIVIILNGILLSFVVPNRLLMFIFTRLFISFSTTFR